MSLGCHDAHPTPILVLEAHSTHWDFIAANNRGTSSPSKSIKAQGVLVAPDSSPDMTRSNYSTILANNRTIQFPQRNRFSLRSLHFAQSDFVYT